MLLNLATPLRRLLQGVLIASLALAALPSFATGYIYWVDGTNQAIGRATLEASPTVTVSWLSNQVVGSPSGITVDSSYVYWSDSDSRTINYIDFNRNAAINLASGLTTPQGLCVYGNYLYFADADHLGTGTLGRVNLTTTVVEAMFITDVNYPTSVACDGTYLYWSNQNGNSIGRADLNGSNTIQNWFSPGQSVQTVAVDGTYVYWGSYTDGSIGRVDKSDTTVFNRNWVSTPNIWSIYVSTNLYWCGDATIGRIVAATGVGNPSFVDASGGSLYYGIAVAPDATVVSLTSFTAQAASAKVALGWTTGSEMDNAGFNVLRSSEAAGTYTRLNTALIPTTGTGVDGSSYTWTDTTANSGTWYYQLEDVDTAGVATLHGPVSATFTTSPILTFQATPPSIFLGGGSLLNWTLEGTPTLSLTGQTFVTGTRQWVTPTTATSYTLSDGLGHASLATVSVKTFSLTDIAGLSLAWGAALGETAYDACYDLNGDGKVDDTDVALCFKGL